MKYVTVAEMVAIEQEADARGLTYARMIENAGFGLAQAVHQELVEHSDEGVLGLVGAGNNGGDTLVALEHLASMGWKTAAYIVRERPVEDPLIRRFLQSGGVLGWASQDPDRQQLKALLGSHRVILDGILGTGFRLPLKPELASFLAQFKHLLSEYPSATIVAVDCPSGVDCDSGQVAAECLAADLTVTMAAYKQGLLKFPAYNYVGRLKLVSIGLEDLSPLPQAWTAVQRFVPDLGWVRHRLPKRPLDAHKGSFGTALIIAGSLNFTGGPGLPVRQLTGSEPGWLPWRFHSRCTARWQAASRRPPGCPCRTNRGRLRVGQRH